MIKSTKRNFLSYDEFLNEELKDEEIALEYLKETLKEDDERIFLLALKRVINAQGENISRIAKKTNLNRENLYKVLSLRGNPRWGTINSVLHNLGLELTIQPSSKSK